MSNFNIKDFVRNTQLSQVKDTENKELLNENIIGLEPINELPTREKEGYELAFAKFLSEDDQEPIHRKEEDEDYDADAEQDDENVGMGYDDEGRPLGEGNMELRDEAMVYWVGKLLDKEIDTLPKDPLAAYMNVLAQDQIDHDEETLRRELGEGQRGDSKPGYSISDLTDRLDSIKMGTGNDYITGRFNQEDKVIVKNSPELGVGTVYGVFPHKIDGKTANEMVYNVEFPNGEDEYYYDSELSFASDSSLEEDLEDLTPVTVEPEMGPELEVAPEVDDNEELLYHKMDGVDDEGRMAKSELYRTAKYAAELFHMMEDNTQLDGWVQAKITKAADYLSSVKHYLEGEEVADMMSEEETEK